MMRHSAVVGDFPVEERNLFPWRRGQREVGEGRNAGTYTGRRLFEGYLLHFGLPLFGLLLCDRLEPFLRLTGGLRRR